MPQRAFVFLQEKNINQVLTKSGIRSSITQYANALEEGDVSSEQLGIQRDDDGAEPDDDEHLSEGWTTVGNFGLAVVLATAPLQHGCHECAENKGPP